MGKYENIQLLCEFMKIVEKLLLDCVLHFYSVGSEKIPELR